MNMPLNTEQLFRELDTIKEGQTVGFAGVHSRLDTLNGRTRTLENKMTIVWWSLGTLGTIVVGVVIKIVSSLFPTP